MRDRMMSSVDCEMRTRRMARIPDTHNCTVPTDAYRTDIMSHLVIRVSLDFFYFIQHTASH